jgi:ubiquinone/menaquinone biosynthesis C-methylase UbiE
MIDQARRKDAKGKVSYRRGSAEPLPLPEACADLIFMSNVYHHLSNPAAVVAECHRVLQPSGHVCVRNGTREDVPHRHFFPGLDALIGSELPSQDDIRRVFVAGGFALVVHQTVKQVIAPNWSSFVEKSGLRADSFLARLADENFEKGMASLRFPGDSIDLDAPVSEQIGWFAFTSNG